MTDKDREGSGTVLVVLAASSDVVFGYGLQERMKRNLNFLRGKGKSAVSEERGKGGDSVLSVLLNPITQDSLAFSGNVQLRLALSYGPNELDEVIDLIDCIHLTVSDIYNSALLHSDL